MDFNIIETHAGFNKMVDFHLLVRTYFQTDMGDAGTVHDWDQTRNKLQDRFSFVPSSEHYQVMQLEFIEDVIFGIVMDNVISGVYRTAYEVESGINNDDKDYTVDLVPKHERAPRNGRIGARAVVFVMSSVC